MKFFLLMNVKMPTIVGISMSGKNSILGLSQPKNPNFLIFFYLWAVKVSCPIEHEKKFFDLGARFHVLPSRIACRESPAPESITVSTQSYWFNWLGPEIFLSFAWFVFSSSILVDLKVPKHFLSVKISVRHHSFMCALLVLRVMIGWLVGCFGLNGPLRQYFSPYRAVSQREGERKENW